MMLALGSRGGASISKWEFGVAVVSCLLPEMAMTFLSLPLRT